MKKLLLVLLTMLTVAGYSQQSTRGALMTVDTATYSNAGGGYTKPTIKMLAVYSGDNLVYYWDLSSWSALNTGPSPGTTSTFYLLATGQSNSGGGADDDIDTTYDARVQGWDSTLNEWVTLRVGYAPMQQTFANGGFNGAYSPSAQFYFARKLANERNCIVRVVNLAQGSTSIDEWWNGGPGAFALAIDAMSVAAAIPAYDLVIWIQGESNNAMSPALYAGKWDSLKNWFRAKETYVSPVTKWVAAGMPRYYNNAAFGIQGMDPTLQGFNYNLDQWDGYATTDSAEINAKPASDGGGARKIHYDSKGLKYLGEQSIWAAWLSLPSKYKDLWQQNNGGALTIYQNRNNVYSNPDITYMGVGVTDPGYQWDVGGDVNVRTGYAYRLKDAIMAYGQPDLGNWYYAGSGNLIGAGINNLGAGPGALAINAGSNNTAVGSGTLGGNTSGVGNTAVGVLSMASNSTASYNTAFGFQALFSNTTAGLSVAIGTQALYANTGTTNTAVGTYAGTNNTSGTGNTYLGYFAGQNNTTGFSNTVIGANITTGNGNNRIFIGNGGGGTQAYHDGTNWTLTGDVITTSNVNLGSKLLITVGSNKSIGTATLSSGTVTVSTTAVTSSSLIFVVYNTPSGTLASGLSAPTGSIVNGTSFVINSLTTAGIVNNLDNSTVRWWIVN